MRRLCVVSIVLLLIAVMTLPGCTPAVPDVQVATKIVVDVDGRSVEIPADPRRVACLYASTAHMLAVVDAGDRIVGAPGGVKRDVLMRLKYPGIESISVPFQEGIINIEELVDIDADLALIRRTTATSPSEVEKLDNLGIPYLVVDYTDMKELKDAIRVVGEVFDEEQQAAAFNTFFDETVALVDERLADLPDSERPRVYHAVNEASRTDRTGDICDEITRRAGIDNVSVTSASNLISDAEKSYTTLEQIYEWNPDHIVANDVNSVAYMLKDSKWSGLSAVKTGRVHPLPVGVTRWVHPGSIEAHMGTLFLARQFHPERFEDIDMAAYTKDYYRRFFGLDLSDEQVRSMLVGEGMRLSKDAVHQ